MSAEDEELDFSIREDIVPNACHFDSRGRILILTGPNQGGKTTYTRAIGVAQVLFQTGLFLPAHNAEISPADLIYTHFTEKEKISTKDGRLGEESRRLGHIFREITKNSLLLMNESLSSTSPGESLYLLMDIVRALRLLGCRAIFTTHLHELAQRIEEINESVEGESRVKSLVAEVEQQGERPARRTYRIRARPPEAMSYAMDIAHKYGISFDNLKKIVQENR